MPNCQHAFRCSTSHLGRQVRLAALFAAALSVPGCVTQQLTVITLSGVVRGESRLSESVPPEAMQLRRNGGVYEVVPEMPLQPGDELRTGPDTSAVVSYPGGARAYIYPGTQVRIGSIVDDIGKVFVKVKGVFKVRTNFVTAGSEGTQYWVNVGAGNEVKVVVVEDVVSLESATGAWPTQRLRAGQQAAYRGASTGVVSAADPAEIRRETDWVRSMDQRVPVKTTVSKWTLVLIPIAIGAIMHDRSGSSSPPAGTSTGTTTGTTPGAPGPARASPPPAPAPAPAPAPYVR
jgi:hypothetical protein